MKILLRLELSPQVLHFQGSFHLGPETFPSLSQERGKSPIPQMLPLGRYEPSQRSGHLGNHHARGHVDIQPGGRWHEQLRPNEQIRKPRPEQHRHAQGTLLPRDRGDRGRGLSVTGFGDFREGAWPEAALRSGPSLPPWVTSAG